MKALTIEISIKSSRFPIQISSDENKAVVTKIFEFSKRVNLKWKSLGSFSLPISWSIDQTECSSIKLPSTNVTSSIENFMGKLNIVVAEKCDCTSKGKSFLPEFLGFFGLWHFYCKYWKRWFFNKSLHKKSATFDRSHPWRNRISCFSQFSV